MNTQISSSDLPAKTTGRRLPSLWMILVALGGVGLATVFGLAFAAEGMDTALLSGVIFVFVYSMVANLIAAANAGEAEMVIVGSEVLYRNDLPVATLIGYIDQVQSAVPATGNGDASKRALYTPENLPWLQATAWHDFLNAYWPAPGVDAAGVAGPAVEPLPTCNNTRQCPGSELFPVIPGYA